MHGKFLAGGLLAVALTLAACGGTTDSTVDVGGGAAAGTCLEGTTDCDDTGILDGDDTEAQPSAGMCAADTTDCDDTGILEGAEGEQDRCLPDAANCDDTPGEDVAPVEDASSDEDEAEAPVEDGTSGEDEAEAPVEDQPVGDMYDSRTAIAHSQALLGLSEAELGLDNRVDVRIGRRGEEQMALTEDYQLGRMTVELDINDMDEWIVTAVTVELPDGPETFTRYLQ